MIKTRNMQIEKCLAWRFDLSNNVVKLRQRERELRQEMLQPKRNTSSDRRALPHVISLLGLPNDILHCAAWHDAGVLLQLLGGVTRDGQHAITVPQAEVGVQNVFEGFLGLTRVANLRAGKN